MVKEYHLGIYTGHDTGLAIVDGDLNILYVFEEERFNGEKMTYFNPYFSLKELMRLDFNHFKTVSFGFNPSEDQQTYLKKFIKFQKVRCAEVLNYLAPRVSWEAVCFVGHHDCHAAGAFLCSGFDHSAILVADGTGEAESTSFYTGEGTSFSRVSTEFTRNFSLGFLYQYFTEWLRYRTPNTSQHCGKIMGLASYGSPVYKKRILEILEKKGDAYRWPRGILREMRGEIAEKFGMPQPRPGTEYSKLQADVAASIQGLLEEMVIEKLQKARETLSFENLCFSGGVAMNSLLNYRILKSNICKNIFIQPLASDRGIALGAALASAAKSPGSRQTGSTKPMHNLYLGFGYDKDGLALELTGLTRKYDLPIHIQKQNISAGEVAKLLHDNQIIGIFQGREEAGPRALGNRSILTAPTIESRNRTNCQVKYREPWRPFAPTVLEEAVGDYFDIDRPEPFMTVIYGVLPHVQKGIEGITHVDGTARLQTVNQDQNPFFYSIIKEYQNITGIPIVLNTSFNINGQPIVRTVYDAVMTFLCSGMDGLLVGDTLLRKTNNFPKSNINSLDRILAEATKNATSIVLKILDYSKETETLLTQFLASPCIKFRRDYGSRPISRCYMGSHTKMSWNIISKIGASVREFIYNNAEKPGLNSGLDKGEICIVVMGDRLIEASSRPNRTYVGFDRNVCRELIEGLHQMPDSEKYSVLDRESHFFDIDSLHSRFDRQ